MLTGTAGDYTPWQSRPTLADALRVTSVLAGGGGIALSLHNSEKAVTEEKQKMGFVERLALQQQAGQQLGI